MTMYIDCWCEHSIDTYHTNITHSILKILSIDYEVRFSDIKFLPIEYLLYPQLKELEVETDGNEELQPDFSFIKDIHLSYGEEISNSYLVTNTEEVIKYGYYTKTLFEYLGNVLVS